LRGGPPNSPKKFGGSRISHCLSLHLSLTLPPLLAPLAMKKTVYDQNISHAILSGNKIWKKKKISLTLVSRQMCTLLFYFEMMQQVRHDVGIFFPWKHSG